jgi:hypothetical protein
MLSKAKHQVAPAVLMEISETLRHQILPVAQYGCRLGFRKKKAEFALQSYAFLTEILLKNSSFRAAGIVLRLQRSQEI